MPNLKGTNEEVSEEVVGTVQEKLNDLNFGDVTDLPDEPEDSTSDNEDDQTDTSGSEDDSTSDDQDDGEEKTGSKDTDSTPEADDKVEIPDGYIRAAKRQGWTDEDIAATIEADPDRALRVFGNAYETSNIATRDFAAIGRAKAEAEQKVLTEQNKVDEPEVKDFITADEIAKIADEDAATAAVLKTMNQRLKDQAIENAQLRKVSSSAQDTATAAVQRNAAARANAAADTASNMVIEQFFGAENMKSYNDFYGVLGEGQNTGDLTPNQHGHRVEVLQVANQLIVGKSAQGIRISDSEALEDAHLLVTGSMREKVITDKIRSSLKTRSKGKTLRPSKSQKTVSNAGDRPAKDRNEAIANAEVRLSKLKW